MADSLGAGASPDAPVVALLMESGLTGAVATLAGVGRRHDENYSTGGGVIGAGNRREVVTDTLRWLQAGAQFLDQLAPVDDPALPAEGMAQFVAVTPDGLLGAVASTAELGERRHALPPLFYAAHGVITQVRLSQAA